MSSPPTGTLTFLFTDIAGSTRLWDTDHAAMKQAHERQAELIACAVQAANGHLVRDRGEGDSTFSVFSSSEDALSAACAFQQALHTQTWPTAVPLRVRAALHRGPAEFRDGDYNSTAVNRCARLRSLAAPGQTLVSQAVADATAGSLPEGMSLLSLGSHRLKDLQRAEQVFQLCHPGLPAGFPSLRSLDTLPTNLPLQLNTFIGREAEIAQLSALLRTQPQVDGGPSTRLLTLLGAGGAGKTRLSVQAGAELLDSYPDGVWLIELAGITDGVLLAQTVATELGLREEPGRSLQDTLRGYLHSRTLLLLLDNCEHLIAACAAFAETLLRGCPHLRFLATSREPLNIPGETLWRIPSLSLPPQLSVLTPDVVQSSEAARLFIDRSQAVSPGFQMTAQNASAIARITRRLDGIPLALELAAARIKSLSVEQIAERLDDRFRLLTGGSRTALPRQQTLRALIDWSYDLLNAQAKVLLARLSVFAGGWTLEAAEKVASSAMESAEELAVWPAPDPAGGLQTEIEEWEVIDVLTALVDKSLVVFEESGGLPRYRMLESIREYGRAKLKESGEEPWIRWRHQHYFSRMAREAEDNFSTPRQAEWLRQLEAEHDNLRTALDFCLASPNGSEAAAHFGANLQQFWWLHGHLSEGRSSIQAALTRIEGQPPRKIQAHLLNGLGVIASMQGDNTEATTRYEQCLAIRRALHDTGSLSSVLTNLGNLVRNQGDYARAGSLYAEALTLDRANGRPGDVAITLMSLGNLGCVQGDMEKAQTFYAECLAIEEEIQDQKVLAMVLNNLCVVATAREEYAEARAYAERCLSLQRTLDHQQGLILVQGQLGSLLTTLGEIEAARKALTECLTRCRSLGDRYASVMALEGYVVFAHRTGRLGLAVRCLAATQALRVAMGFPAFAFTRTTLERVQAELETQLDPAVFAALMTEGAALSLDAVLDLALTNEATH